MTGDGMGATRQDVVDYYRSEAEKHGEAGTSTIQDNRTRELEIAALFSYIRPSHRRLLEIGCGNGYVAEMLVRKYDVSLDAFDYSEDLARIAAARDLSGSKGVVKFRQGDVLELNASASYDLAFSERCLQNLLTWEEQKRALGNICRALRQGGEYVMLESFWTGLNNQNAARRELDLPEVPQHWRNLFFHEEQTLEFMQSLGFECLGQNCFLSGYYFGSRVLLPALTPKGKPVTSQSILNDYFRHLPPGGDFSPMKIVHFRRR